MNSWIERIRNAEANLTSDARSGMPLSRLPGAISNELGDALWHLQRAKELVEAHVALRDFKTATGVLIDVYDADLHGDLGVELEELGHTLMGKEVRTAPWPKVLKMSRDDYDLLSRLVDDPFTYAERVTAAGVPSEDESREHHRDEWAWEETREQLANAFATPEWRR